MSTSAFGVLLAAWVCSAQNSSSIDGYRDFQLDFAGGITVGIVIAVVCLIWGLFYLLVGARYPKASVASNTFLFATGGLYFLLNFFDIEPYICLIVGAAVGIVSIAITLKIWKAGLFVLGGAAGFVIWLVVKALAASSFTDVATVYASLAATVLVAALLAIKFEKQIFIAATSLIGSFFLVQGVDALIPNHASVFSLINDTSGLVCSYDFAWCTGIYIAIFVIAFIGMFVQFKVTAKFYKRRRGVKNKSDYRRKRRGKRAYAKEEDDAPRERRRYRDEDKREERHERREERHERKHSVDAPASGGKGRLQEENAELKVRIGDLERKLEHAQDKLDGAWDLTQEEKDLVTRFRVDKRENARIAKEAAAREKARQKEEQEAREAEERDRRRREEEDERAAKKSRKADKRERERREREEREREREEERLRQEEEDAYAAKKNRKKTKDDPPPYKPEPEKKSKKKKGSEKKRRDSTSEDSAEG